MNNISVILISNWLDDKDICNLSCVNKYCHSVIDSCKFWKERLYKVFNYKSKINNKNLLFLKYKYLLANEKALLNELHCKWIQNENTLICCIIGSQEHRMEYERVIKYLKKPRLRKIIYDKAKFEDFSYNSPHRNKSLYHHNQYLNFKRKLKIIVKI